MIKDKRVISIIPARGGSKGIPRKNIRLLNSIPLIAHSIKDSLKSKYIDKTIVSTDDQEISEIAKKYGAKVIMRPSELATDSAPILLVIQHIIKELESNGEKVDIIVLLQPTHPIRQEEEIDTTIEKLYETNASSVITLRKVPKHFHPEWQFSLEKDKIKNLSEKKVSNRRQELEEKYHRTGSVYTSKRDTIMILNSIYGTDCRAVVIPNEYWVNIDEEGDLKVAEFLLKIKNENNVPL